ncbi:branched-chain amino acid transaminase [Colwellia sp. C1TZA3]|uniref:branched-chain amino acid transaminase n=1 Tax=Colwellia sp. C1TZA3 TaxID=2508879 RepID=UPI0011B9DBC1|nr:branched-chain amino acid transaminase [Colwellia sp. C1TZA3]TWX72957.1 branched-chain amino acid transaminase [Colwellia sp. C1TZA3]
MTNDKRLIWFKGDIIPVNEAKINVLSPTSQFGANVFEGLRAYWNEADKELYVFKLEEHINRLLKSIKMMRFESQYDAVFLKNSVIEIVKANKYQEDITIRQTIFLDGFGSWASASPTDMFIAPIAKGRQYPPDKIGIECCVSSWARINDKSMSPKIKMGANYMNSRMGQMEAMRNGYDSTIFLNDQGKVSEGPGSCIFIVRDGQLITPPITASILESITRTTILVIARNDLGLDVVERDVDRTELYIADEIFFCGTAVEIVPVVGVDKLVVGDAKKGMITSRIEDLYFDIVRGLSDKHKCWLTPTYKV